MKLSVSNIAWSSEHDDEMYDFLAQNGFCGVEIAPTRIVPAPPYKNIDKAKCFTEGLSRCYGLEIPSMQSIWFGRQERIFGVDKERDFLISYTERAVDFAEAINCGNIVFGCPSNRRRDVNDERLGIEFLRKIGEYCIRENTVFAIEPNPVIYNTDYINTTEQARELVEKLGSDGIKINYDFGTVKYNQERVEDVPLDLVNHIHISEPFLAPIEKNDEHKKLAKILSKSDYSGYVSVEMKDCGDMEQLKSVLKYVKDVFS